ncbi:MAG: ImmA/IrrE family metallo-endopeptidase [Balneolaceae bacterium]|nr:ImmA/IrrE family metallo-endopeptidase [Balneolaceae bacterium]
MRVLVPFLAMVFAILSACSGGKHPGQDHDKVQQAETRVAWSEIDSIDVNGFNSDLQPGQLTMDVGIYFPSNFDSTFNKVTLSRMLESLKAAKEIYKPTGVQIKLLWVKTGKVNPRYFSIQANEVPGIPNAGYTNLYEHSYRNPAKLTEETKKAFEHIVEPAPDNHRTIYLVALQDVFYPFLTVSEGRNWMMKTVRTGGLSFPGYSYPGTIPKEYRGVITITNLDRPDRFIRTIAHELGHKVMNVSHEYKDTRPQHEVYADGGLMLYGEGEDIPSGKDGRWHLERLKLSPFLYQLGEDGSKTWNSDYLENGHYYDPIYGKYVVHFQGASPIDEDW